MPVAIFHAYDYTWNRLSGKCTHINQQNMCSAKLPILPAARVKGNLQDCPWDIFVCPITSPSN